MPRTAASPSTGQNVVFVANLATAAPATAVFFTDADLNSGNVIFTVPMNASAGPVNVGVQPGTTFGFSVFAFDNYFTGALTDAVEGMLFTPGNARFGVGRRSVWNGRAAQPRVGAGHDGNGA